jgi:uncharacterized membrane protein
VTSIFFFTFFNRSIKFLDLGVLREQENVSVNNVHKKFLFFIFYFSGLYDNLGQLQAILSTELRHAPIV